MYNLLPFCGKKLHSSIIFVRVGCFEKRVRASGKAYFSYIEEGLNQGRRDELVGGGLIRSLGGWSEVKKLRSAAHAHMMSDERILGESDFVASILSEAGEIYERHYESV